MPRPGWLGRFRSDRCPRRILESAQAGELSTNLRAKSQPTPRPDEVGLSRTPNARRWISYRQWERSGPARVPGLSSTWAKFTRRLE